MFSREHWQIKLVYAGFGALLLFIGMLLSPVTAQREIFRAIECYSLTVVDPDTGEACAVLSTDKHGGTIKVYNEDGEEMVRLHTVPEGGVVNVYGKEVNAQVTLSTREHGGDVRVWGKNGQGHLHVNENGGMVDVGNTTLSVGRKERERATASLGIVNFDGHLGGYVGVERRESCEGTLKALFDGTVATVSIAEMWAGRYGGSVRVRGVNKQALFSKAEISATERGGRVEVSGVGQGKVMMGSEESGNGVISTLDKNGNPLK